MIQTFTNGDTVYSADIDLSDRTQRTKVANSIILHADGRITVVNSK